MLVTEIRCKKQSNETWRALITKFPEITIRSYVLFLIPTPKKFKSVMDFFYRKVTGYKAVNLSKRTPSKMLRIFSTIIKLIFRKAFPKNISKSMLLNFKPRTFNQVNFIPRRFHYNPLISVADQRSYFSILFYGILIQEVKQMPNVYLNIAI